MSKKGYTDLSRITLRVRICTKLGSFTLTKAYEKHAKIIFNKKNPNPTLTYMQLF